MVDWPTTPEQLSLEQERLASAAEAAWAPSGGPFSVGGCFVCFPRNRPGVGAEGDRGWAGAALLSPEGGVAKARALGTAGASYQAGLLALREGPLLEAAVRALPRPPEVLLVNATGRDHPRRAGLALHLGAVLDLPSVGVTHRPLLAAGEWPGQARGDRSALELDGDLVGYWLRTRSGKRPLAVHAAWRTDPRVAAEVVLAASSGRARTPEPLRQARRVARTARAATGSAARRLRLLRSEVGRSAANSSSGVFRLAGVEITAAPRDALPFEVEALVVEDDTWLVLGADAAYREPRESLLEVLTATHEARPELPGTVVLLEDRPPRFHAVVHDLDRDPSWKEEWIEAALRKSVEMAGIRGLAALGLDPLGCRHGRLDPDRFLTLLEGALRAARHRSLRRIWLVAG